MRQGPKMGKTQPKAMVMMMWQGTKVGKHNQGNGRDDVCGKALVGKTHKKQIKRGGGN